MFVAKPAHTEFVKAKLEPVLGELTERLDVVRINADVDGYYFVIEDCSLDDVTAKMDDASWTYRVDESTGRIKSSQWRTEERDREFFVAFVQLTDVKVYGGL